MWFAAIGLLLFVVSALMHPLMVWTGPQTVQFRPPSLTLDQQKTQQQLAQGLTQLSNLDKTSISIAKWIPTAQGAMLQVTGETGARRYYPLSDEQSEYSDAQQARWLAQYYTGETREVDSLLYMDSFSTEYPSVNRLLPVFKVLYKGDDQLSVFVHTETNALAAINNDWKRGLQTLFQWLHTWSWLEVIPELRVFIVAALMVCLLLMSVAGMVLLLLFKRRVSPRKSTAIHRLIAWTVWLPLTGLLFSGLYHLLQGAWVGDTAESRLLTVSSGQVLSSQSARLSLGELTDSDHKKATHTSAVNVSAIAQSLQGQAINSLSLLRFENDWVLRASLAHKRRPLATESEASSGEHSHHASDDTKSALTLRNQRFDGHRSETGARFYSLQGQSRLALSDSRVVTSLARQWLGLPSSQNLALSLVTRFGPNYDFRNKRLPVWQVDVGNEAGDRLFIDPVSGLLVDHQRSRSQWERWSFSNLHKWNPLVAFLGREGRDLLVVLVLFLIGALGWFGVRMRRSR
jgi:hypothetical protein